MQQNINTYKLLEINDSSDYIKFNIGDATYDNMVYKTSIDIKVSNFGETDKPYKFYICNGNNINNKVDSTNPANIILKHEDYIIKWAVMPDAVDSNITGDNIVLFFVDSTMIHSLEFGVGSTSYISDITGKYNGNYVITKVADVEFNLGFDYRYLSDSFWNTLLYINVCFIWNNVEGGTRGFIGNLIDNDKLKNALDSCSIMLGGSMNSSPIDGITCNMALPDVLSFNYSTFSSKYYDQVANK